MGQEFPCEFNNLVLYSAPNQVPNCDIKRTARSIALRSDFSGQGEVPLDTLCQGGKFMKAVTVTFLALFCTIEARADDAQVLPKGRFRVRLNTAYTVAENQLSADGNAEGIGSSFTRTLDSRLLSALNPATAETVRRLNAASPGLGDLVAADLQTDVKSETISNVVALEYGITNRLSVGFILPIVHSEVSVNANAGPNDQLTARINALKDGDPRKAILKQVAGNLSTETFNNLLRQNYNYSDGFQDWSGTGLGDLELGAKYNYYRDDKIYSTLKGGLRLPTGREDDPNKLFDCAFGDGQTDLGLYHITDIQLSERIGTTFEVGYIVQLPDSANVRIPLSEEIPISPQAQELDRKLGDYYNAEAEANFMAFRGFTLAARYRFQQKFSDSYSSPAPGVDVKLLEKNTAELSQTGILNAEYTNLADVRAGRSKLPYAVSVFYRQPLSGENIMDSRTGGMQLKTYF